jgi:acyl carrier protein
MDILEFSTKLESEFEDLEKGSVTPDTEFRNLPGWSSMYALIIIAFIDLNFDIILNSTELKEAKTVSDLYYLATKKSV